MDPHAIISSIIALAVKSIHGIGWAVYALWHSVGYFCVFFATPWICWKLFRGNSFVESVDSLVDLVGRVFSILL